ncbi:MAG TPA: nitrate/sulfonate/bicarbonate ABC transporter ATP-binding protein [Steroidobacteraceae bacterium]|nr:nitrate/sulfonate/bicarbonate ABC transporter ATP-binding protein [Steroidobacteraceae bacterium]
MNRETQAAGTDSIVIELRGVCKRFTRPTAEPFPVLVDIDLTLREGEIVGLLGRSGSGKSTLLRIAGGLLSPTSGEVRYRNAPLFSPSEGIAVVFQTFALYPWLTVLQNVELGLDALGLPSAEVRRRANAAIDLIGLDGFQSAFPRELSGGMRQRVGFARAIVSEPVLLLMDEPFSALDVLTAETLRTDFLDLWTEHQLPTRSVLLVTHNIEEAALMCDRVVVLGSNPGHLVAEIPVSLSRPRNRMDAGFQTIVSEIYSVLTTRMSAAVQAQARVHGGLALHLPNVSVHEISGLLEALAEPPHQGTAELGKLAASFALEINHLLPVAAALHLLEFAELTGDSIKLTAAGRVFVQSGTEDRKRLFREHLLTFVPFAAHILQILAERDDHQAPRERFELELEDHLNASDAEETLRVVISWGRYAEVFTYDDSARSFAIPPAR